VADIVRRPTLRRTLAARGTAPGTAGPAAEAASRFEALTEALLDAAAREVLIRRLGDALSQTSRQVHTLERRIDPALTSQIRAVEHVLSEREREEHGRLKHLARRHASRARG
jgi:vacuolar-type H+-ATPase subunit D/Vma8